MQSYSFNVSDVIHSNEYENIKSLSEDDDVEEYDDDYKQYNHQETAEQLATTHAVNFFFNSHIYTSHNQHNNNKAIENSSI